MKLIIGLGNPGREYEKTRHNVGFLALDEFQSSYDFDDFKLESKFKAFVSSGNIGGEKVVLAKPTTFMNLSGQSLLALKQFYKINTEDILVVYDDKDMEFGKLRFRSEGRDGGHNGIKSIIKVLGTEQFDRLKIAVGEKEHPAFKDASAFVLGKFSEKDLEDLNIDTLPKVCGMIEEWISSDNK